MKYNSQHVSFLACQGLELWAHNYKMNKILILLMCSLIYNNLGSKLKFWITIFIIKNSPSNVRVGIKSTNIFDCLAFEENMIEEHKKLIEKKGLSKEYSK
jgi:hypothetical protein